MACVFSVESSVYVVTTNVAVRAENQHKQYFYYVY